MAEEKNEKLCDAVDCDGNCEACEGEKINSEGIDAEKLTHEELLALYKSQRDLVDAMVNENEQLIKEQEELKKKVEKGNEYLDQLAMIKRDFENYKRRTNAAKDNSKEEGKILVIERILPILDVFDRAKESLKEKPELEPFAMIERQFLKVLGEVGLEEIEVLNTEFDPSTSYAIAKAEAGEENKNKIIEVLSKGYKLGDKIVKYAQVKVGC